MCEDPDQERNAIAHELVDIEKQLSDKEMVVVVKQAECARLAQQASDVKGEEAPPLVNDAIRKEMAKLT
jgi:GTPase involved in cell partitioning and DNA repair